jgi:hypothetical protein
MHGGIEFKECVVLRMLIAKKKGLCSGEREDWGT